MGIMYKIWLLTITLTLWLVLAVGQNQNEAPRCFRFTWLGPDFHNGSMFLNATCRQATRLSTGIPCEHPLVVSYDGTWPDVRYIWKHHREDATCIPTENNVCARYTYYFNGLVVNSTYMCTRAIDANNTAITSGCYEEGMGSFLTRVCICQSSPGVGVLPCNSASLPFISPIMSLIAVLIFLTNSRVILSVIK